MNIWNLIDTLYKDQALDQRRTYFFVKEPRGGTSLLSGGTCQKTGSKDLRKESFSQRFDRIYQLLQEQLLLLRHPVIQ